MKKLITILFCLFTISAIAQTATVRTTSSSNITVYTKAGTDAADSAAKKNTRTYTDQKVTAAQNAAAADATKKAATAQSASQTYTDNAIAINNAIQDSIWSERLKAATKLPTITNGSGIRIDSLGPGKYQLTAQVYWDPVAKTFKINY